MRITYIVTYYIPVYDIMRILYVYTKYTLARHRYIVEEHKQFECLEYYYDNMEVVRRLGILIVFTTGKTFSSQVLLYRHILLFYSLDDF